MFNNKKILIIGIARSGIASAKYLLKNGAKIVLTDSKKEEDLKDAICDLKEYDELEYIFGRNPEIEELADIDFAVISPGVPTELDYILKLKENGKSVISEVELAYIVSRDKEIDFIGITGTNGKTTTTSIVGEICKASGRETFVAGNIGFPAITAVDEGDKSSVVVTELSSFQLESIEKFRPKCSLVLNLTEDHLNRHHTMENYADAKARIFENQIGDDVVVLNYDDEYTKGMAENAKCKVVFFSQKEKLADGIWVDDEGYIVISSDGDSRKIMNSKELSLPGKHNLENCMAAIGLCVNYGIDDNIIVNVLKTFKAVEHRLEYVDKVDGIRFINDSKGTNPDSTIKAVQSYEDPIILIAGGYDKNSDFNELFEIAKEFVRTVIVLGQTANLIEETARKHGLSEIIHVESIREAVEKSFEIAEENDVVLLSPACASWGMYNNYEERGRDFKNCVGNLKRRG